MFLIVVSSQVMYLVRLSCCFGQWMKNNGHALLSSFGQRNLSHAIFFDNPWSEDKQFFDSFTQTPFIQSLSDQNLFQVKNAALQKASGLASSI